MEDLDALLADLQNTVPGQNNTLPSSVKAHNLSNASNTSGYGSLNGVRKGVQSPSPTPYQSKLESPQLVSQTQNGSLPRSANNLPYSNNNSLPRSTTPSHQHNNTGNLSELDSLLEDLSNARYNNSLVEKHHSTGYTNGTQSPTTYINDSIKRPSVDSLLDELSNAHTSPLYALPNTPKNNDPQKPGRHVTITVRETTTEKIRGTPSPGYINHSAIAHSSLNQKAPVAYTSSATKELDDLMASLSDFKSTLCEEKKISNPSNFLHTNFINGPCGSLTTVTLSCRLNFKININNNILDVNQENEEKYKK
uniref:CSON012710 protein n=1 Tax=Culicoides sonorensis TaxID=179676 RepID=A0A336KWW8_CULSO